MDKNIKGVEEKALIALKSYKYPGNIRELENIIERAVILSEREIITINDLGIYPVKTNPVNEIKGTLDEIQKRVITETLKRWNGNRTHASKELGISRRTLQNKIKEYGISSVWQQFSI